MGGARFRIWPRLADLKLGGRPPSLEQSWKVDDPEEISCLLKALCLVDFAPEKGV